MTFARSISPALRSGLMIAAGTALMLLPLLLGAGAAAIMTGITAAAAMLAITAVTKYSTPAV